MRGPAWSGALVAVVVALLGPSVAGATTEATVEAPTVETASGIFGDCDDPVELLLMTQERIGTDGELADALMEIRHRFPGLFADTPPPPGPVRLPAPFEPSAILVLAYPALDDYDDWFVELVAEAVDEGRVVILVDTAHVARLDDLLDSRAVPLAAVTVIDDIPFDSVWIRDYGPIAVESAAGHGFVDPRYFVNCVYNDAVPTHLAQEIGGFPVYRPPMWLEGGDLLSNGAGLCFSTAYSAQRNGLTEDQYTTLLRDYFGCEQTVLLTALNGNAAAHVDLFLAVAAEDRVLLGEFVPTEDPVNAAIMDLNELALSQARTAAGQPLRIDRVPMPPVARTWPRDPEGPAIRSYLNLVVFNGTVFVPIYRDAGARTDLALERIRQAFPDRRVVPLAVDGLALDKGALHCVTVTVPVAGRSP